MQTYPHGRHKGVAVGVGLLGILDCSVRWNAHSAKATDAAENHKRQITGVETRLTTKATGNQKKKGFVRGNQVTRALTLTTTLYQYFLTVTR